MKRGLNYLSFLLLIIDIAALIYIGIEHAAYFDQLTNTIKIIWGGIVAVLTLLGIIPIIKNVMEKQIKSLEDLLSSIYLRIIIFVYSIFILILVINLYGSSQKGTVNIRVEPDSIVANAAIYNLSSNTLLWEGKIPIKEKFNPGSYKLKAWTDGFLPESTVVTLEPGRSISWTYSPQKPMGAVIINFRPEDSNLTIDGVMREKKTNFQYTLPAGYHRIVVSKEEYIPFDTLVYINSNYRRIINVVLKKLPEKPKGPILITFEALLNGKKLNTAAAKVYNLTERKWVGFTGHSIECQEGTHSFEVRYVANNKYGYSGQEKITINADDSDMKRSFEIKLQEVLLCTLQVESSHPGTSIFVDDESIASMGINKKQKAIQVFPGQRKVYLKTQNGEKSESKNIYLENGEIKKISFSF